MNQPVTVLYEAAGALLSKTQKEQRLALPVQKQKEHFRSGLLLVTHRTVDPEGLNSFRVRRTSGPTFSNA